ncbi:MAG TPA: YfhO family protein [Bacteroidia bacterium]|nr:YfhO family protein [Bacteroidia bacterium]
MNKPKDKALNTNSGQLGDFFEQLGNRAFLLALFLVLFVAFFVYKDFLLFKNMFQYKDIGSDTLNAMYPYYKHYANYVKEFGLPQWSFAEGMGQGIMSGFLRDPIQIISILAGPDKMPGIFVYMEVLKIVLAGMFFYFFLKAIKASNYSAIMGTLLFSFCGFMVIGSCWYLFTFEALNVAVLLLGFERLYQKKGGLIFSLGIFLTGISFPVNLFTFGLFILTYAAFRFLSDQKFERRAFLTLLGNIVLYGSIGLLFSGPFLLENIFQLIESPRGSGPDSYFSRLSGSPMFALSNKVEFGSSVMRMFSNDILGTGNSFTGVQNYLESPFGYCGLISLLLVSQVFSLIEKNKRRLYIALLVIWLIPSVFPWFRYAFWLFSGDYFRAYSFFVSLVFIIFSVHSLDLILRQRKISLVMLLGTLAFWFILSALTYKSTITYPNGQQAVQELKTDDTVSFFVKTFMVFYAVILYLIGTGKNLPVLKTILLVLVGFELIYLSQISVNKRNVVSERELHEKTGYNDYSVEAVQYLKSIDKDFYRIDKSYFSGGAMHGSITDHKVHGYYGTSSYNSFAQMNFVNFMRGFDVIDKTNEYASRWVDGLRNRPMLEPLSGVRYMLTKSTTMNPLWQSTYDSIAKFGDVVVMKHRFVLPLGFTYKAYILQNDFNKLSSTQKDLLSYRACVLDDKEAEKASSLTRLGLNDSLDLRLFNWNYLAANTDSLKKESLVISSFNPNRIVGDIKVDHDKIMYLSFPYDKGWHFYLDGKECDKMLVNYGMCGMFVPAGSHHVEMDFHLRFFAKGFILSLAALFILGLTFFINRKRNTIPTQHEQA